MKKRYLIVILVGATAVVGGVQWRALRGLERENEILTQKKVEAGRNESSRSVQTASKDVRRHTIPAVSGVTNEEVTKYYEEVVDLFLKVINGERTEGMREKWMGFSRRSQDFSSSNISLLAELLQNEDRIPESNARFDDLRGEIFDEVLGELIAPAVPFQMMVYLKENPDLGEREFSFSGVFRLCLEKNLSLALKLYEEEVAAGNLAFQVSSIRSQVLLGLATHDPDKMLSMAQTLEFQNDSEALKNLGGFIDDRMENSVDSLRFLEALERAKGKEGDAELLEEIRVGFIREIGQRLKEWPFEETKALVSRGFTSGEQYEFFAQISRWSDLKEAEKWGDWFLGVESEDWSQWAGDRPEFKKHPMVKLIESSAMSNREFGEKYLEKIPVGPLRDEAMLDFAWRLADWQPERAAVYVDQLPKSKGKSRLSKKIKKALN